MRPPHHHSLPADLRSAEPAEPRAAPAFPAQPDTASMQRASRLADAVSVYSRSSLPFTDFFC